MAEPPHLRVVSLVPSVTETLHGWGIDPVACTRFCERPDLPHVGGTKDPDLAAIVALHADLVVMCDEENREEDALALTAAGIAVHSCSPRTVSGVARALEGLATAVGAGVRPLPGLPAPAPVERRAFVPIWRRPWMTLSADTYGSSLLAHLGVGNVFGGAALRYPEVDLAGAARRRPDLVIAPSEPYPFGPRHVAELSQVAPVVLVDGADLFWWGVRTPAALERLRARLDQVA
ncbi:MAG: hypothetical protein HYX34_04945 [Actinobacteria bacterium]|nr:hypothetical protein [Actinomycetota bacterium]